MKESSDWITVLSQNALQRMPRRPKSHTGGVACGTLIIYLSVMMTSTYQGTISPYSPV